MGYKEIYVSRGPLGSIVEDNEVRQEGRPEEKHLQSSHHNSSMLMSL